MKSTNRQRRPSRRNSQADKRKQFRKDDLQDFSDSKEMTKRSTNDPKWYASNPQLLKDAASYPFSQPVGRAFETHSIGTTTTRSVPGICALVTKPAYGWGGYIDTSTGNWTSDVKAPANVAAAELYSFIRHANSGAKNYEAADLFMYVAAISNMYSYITWAMRLYGLARMYDQYNRYMPQELVRINGVDWNSLQNNLANFRYALNVLINKVATLYVPATMPIFQRLAFLYQNVYSEGPSTKDQLYLYVPHCFHQFKIASDGHGYLAETSAISENTKMSWTQVISLGESMFQAIWDEEDFATMSGDILKAYQGNVLTINVLNEDYGLVPINDEMVLTQMKNATVLTTRTTTGLEQVSMPNYTGLLIPQAYYYFNYNGTTDTKTSWAARRIEDATVRDRIMTIPAVDPTPEMVIEASRMMVGFDKVKDVTSSSTIMTYVAPTSEVVTEVRIDYLDAGTNTFTLLKYASDYYINTSNALAQTSVAFWFRVMQMIKSFKYLPEVTICFGNGVSDSTDMTTVSETYMFEVDNYTSVGSDEIKKLNEAALLSLFAVNSIGRNA